MTGERLTAVERALLACLRHDRIVETSELDDLTAVQWAELAGFAAVQRVRPLLYRAVNAPAIKPHVPVAVLDELGAACRQITMRNLRAHAELAQIAAALGDLGIRVMLLKGAHLALTVYGDPGLREMVDIDIMVPRDDLMRAYRRVLERGYAPWGDAPPEAEASVRNHAPRLTKRGVAAFEIHWNLTRPAEPYSIDPAGLWLRAVPVAIGGTRALGLGTEDLLLHLCLHASYHHQFRFGLRPFCDVGALLSRTGGELDWEVVRTRAAEWRWTRGVYLALDLASSLTGAAVPAHVLADLRPADMNDGVAATARAQTLTTDLGSALDVTPVARVASEEPLRSRLAHLWARLFPNREELATAHPAFVRRTHLVGYVLRPFVLAWRYGLTVLRLLVGKNSALTEAAARQNQLYRWLNP